ncbi:MAG: diguanylate cyclase [Rhodocyclales bacterium]|nr:diguanylate cyclase [Rhodocyclales bacterium]
MTHSRSPLIDWNASFDIGHAEIDAQHRKLVELLNGFAADVEHFGSGRTPLFDRFQDALREHFVFEEELLRRLGVSVALLDTHIRHHEESMHALDGLRRQMAADPREHSSAALAEIAHCMLADLLDEDRCCFVSVASAVPPPAVAPVLKAFRRLVDLLTEHHERIAEVRDYYLTLLDDFPTPICRADRHGRFDWFNRTWLSLTGMQQQTAVGDGWLAAMHADDRPAFLRAWQHNFAARLPFAAEYRVADASGAWCWIHHIGHPFFDGGHGFLGYIGALFDITERRRAEESLRVSAVVFEHAAEAIMITDALGRIEAINPAFSRISGYSAAEAVGAASNLLRSGFHDDAFYAAIWRAVQSQGNWQGEIVNRRKNGEIFPVWLSITTIRDAAGAIVRMVGVFDDVVSARTSQAHLMHLAHHDALTGLPNRLLFGARVQHSIERCAREDSRLAVLFIDLDNFKPVNDQLGHKVGDRVLCDVAAQLSGALRRDDTVARFGGDEFVALVERAENAEDAQRVAQKLLDIFPIRAQPCRDDLSIGASFGFALYPDDGGSFEDLIDAADRAMYRVKRQRRQAPGPDDKPPD